MKRYHREIFFPEYSHALYNTFILSLRKHKRVFSEHALEQIYNRVPRCDFKDLCNFSLIDVGGFRNMFEYYEENGDIVKACFRVRIGKCYDYIFVISKEYTIVTIYVNHKDDTHNTLNRGNYNKE